MQLAPSGRFVFVAQWVLAVVLPLFLFLGRAALGAPLGWTAVLGAGFGALITVLLLVPPVLALFDPVAREARSVRSRYALVTIVMWVGLVVAALAIPDADDAGELPSVLGVWFGVPGAGSVIVFGIAAGVAMLAWIAAVVTAIHGIVAGRRGD